MAPLPSEMLDLYPTARLQVLGGVVVIQPVWQGAVAGPSLSLDLETGSVCEAEHPPILEDYTLIYGVLGLLSLTSGPAIAVITGIEQVAFVRGHPLFRVTSTHVVSSSSSSTSAWSASDRRLLGLFARGLDPTRYGWGMHVAYGGDATLTEQKAREADERDAEAEAGAGAGAEAGAGAGAGAEAGAGAGAGAEAVPSLPASLGGDEVASLPVLRPSAVWPASWRRADLGLTWNAAIAAPLLDAGLGAFVPPAFLGFAERLDGLAFEPPSALRRAEGSVTLLARRGRARAGTRQWRRGADAGGSVANFVETEQILEIEAQGAGDGDGDGDGGAYVASFVQVRGSIPVPWAQAPTLAYKIPIVVAPRPVCARVFARHAAAATARYGHVTALSLANLTGREGAVSRAFRDAVADSRAGTVDGEWEEGEQRTGGADAGAEAAGAAAAGAAASGAARGSTPSSSSSSRASLFNIVLFDFHKECGATRYDRLSLLWDRIERSFAEYGFFLARRAGAPAAPGGLRVLSRQRGAFRTNCIDVLDRTNVVQGLLGRRALERALAALRVAPPGADLAAAFPAAERRFRVAWADHGDALSTEYAGTGAMKSAFTRTGKRDAAGLIDDGLKSLTRYCLNNFFDGDKQDAIDLVVGAYDPKAKEETERGKSAKGKTATTTKNARETEPDRGAATPPPSTPASASAPARNPHAEPYPSKRASIALPLLLALLLLVKGIENLAAASPPQALLGLALLALAAAALAFVRDNGRKFVDAPTLRPDLVVTWT